MKDRIEWIFSQIEGELDAVVIMNGEEPFLDVDLPYITGTESGLFESCMALITPDGRSLLITSALEETSGRGGRAEVMAFRNRKEKEDLIVSALSGLRRIGINSDGLVHSNYSLIRRLCPEMEMIDVSRGLEKARMIKDAEEISRLRTACAISSRVAEEIPDMLSEGATESELSAEITYRMIRYGATSSGFRTNASFGENTAEPHHDSMDRTLLPGDTTLFDFGAQYKGYTADITRTYFFRKADEMQRRMYEVVLEAQRAGLEAIRAGVDGKDVDAAARTIIDASEFKGMMIHSLGHAIGLSVHDGGRMAPGVDMVLRENMVLTVEPGVYIPGKGGVRIEDDIVVTKNGCEILTNASKEMRVV